MEGPSGPTLRCVSVQPFAGWVRDEEQDATEIYYFLARLGTVYVLTLGWEDGSRQVRLKAEALTWFGLEDLDPIADSFEATRKAIELAIVHCEESQPTSPRWFQAAFKHEFHHPQASRGTTS